MFEHVYIGRRANSALWLVLGVFLSSTSCYDYDAWLLTGLTSACSPIGLDTSSCAGKVACTVYMGVAKMSETNSKGYAFNLGFVFIFFREFFSESSG